MRGEGELGGRRAQVGRQHVRVVRIQHGCLDRGAEQRIGVMHEIGVKRVVTGDENGHRSSPGPPGPARLLPERCPGAGPSGHQHRVQPGHVHAELQRGRRGQPGDLAGPQGVLQRAALVGQVTGPVGGHPLGQISRARLGQLPPRGLRYRLRAAPRAHEHQRRHVAAHQLSQQLGSLGSGGPPDRGASLTARAGQRRLPQRECQRRARRAVGS